MPFEYVKDTIKHKYQLIGQTV